jgi:hypothetical protein
MCDKYGAPAHDTIAQFFDLSLLPGSTIGGGSGSGVGSAGGEIGGDVAGDGGRGRAIYSEDAALEMALNQSREEEERRQEEEQQNLVLDRTLSVAKWQLQCFAITSKLHLAASLTAEQRMELQAIAESLGLRCHESVVQSGEGDVDASETRHLVISCPSEVGADQTSGNNEKEEELPSPPVLPSTVGHWGSRAVSATHQGLTAGAARSVEHRRGEGESQTDESGADPLFMRLNQEEAKEEVREEAKEEVIPVAKEEEPDDEYSGPGVDVNVLECPSCHEAVEFAKRAVCRYCPRCSSGATPVLLAPPPSGAAAIDAAALNIDPLARPPRSTATATAATGAATTAADLGNGNASGSASVIVATILTAVPSAEEVAATSEYDSLLQAALAEQRAREEEKRMVEESRAREQEGRLGKTDEEWISENPMQRPKSGFICPLCMEAFVGPDELQTHFFHAHPEIDEAAQEAEQQEGQGEGAAEEEEEEEDEELIEHKVTASDTAVGICLRYNVKIQRLRELNGFQGQNIQTCAALMVPRGKAKRVQDEVEKGQEQEQMEEEKQEQAKLQQLLLDDDDDSDDDEAEAIAAAAKLAAETKADMEAKAIAEATAAEATAAAEAKAAAEATAAAEAEATVVAEAKAAAEAMAAAETNAAADTTAAAEATAATAAAAAASEAGGPVDPEEWAL